MIKIRKKIIRKLSKIRPSGPLSHYITDPLNCEVSSETSEPSQLPVAPGPDGDADGLDDKIEVWGNDGNNDGDLNDPEDLIINVAPYNADPYQKDIFIEVDWMEGDVFAGMGSWTWNSPVDSTVEGHTVTLTSIEDDGAGNPYVQVNVEDNDIGRLYNEDDVLYYYPYSWKIRLVTFEPDGDFFVWFYHTHKPDPDALDLVVNAFDAHGITLHIDDGTGVWSGLGGGGETIDHYTCIDFWNWPVANQVGFYDVWQFDENRYEIFRYVIIAHYGYNPWLPTQGYEVYEYWGEVEGGDPAAASSSLDGYTYDHNEIYICDQYCHDNNAGSYVLQFAKTFMHELGHTLELPDYGPGEPGAKSMNRGPSSVVDYAPVGDPTYMGWDDLDFTFFIYGVPP
jgi:hypothetical protein